MRRDPTSEKSCLYEFKMDFFDNGDPEEFLLLVRKSNMTLDASGNLEMDAKLQYFCTIVCGEALHQSYMLSADVKNTSQLTAEAIILGIGCTLSPC